MPGNVLDLSTCLFSTVCALLGPPSMSVPAAFVIVMVAAFTLSCLVTDLRTRRIPNWLTVPALVLGLVTHSVTGGIAGLGFSLMGFLTGFGILLVLWLIGGGGGGDVKMMGALGAWLGAWLTVLVFLTSAVVTMVMVGGVIGYTACTQGFSTARRRCMGRAIAEANAERSKPTGKRGRSGRVVPYAVPIAVSTWIVLAIAWSAGHLLGVAL